MLVIWTCVLLTLTPAFSMAVSPNTVAFLELARLRSATTHAASPESAGGHAASIPYPGTMDDALLASALSSAVQATLSSATTTARPAVQQTLQSGEQAVISGAPKLQAGFQIAVTDLPHSLASSSAAAADVAGLAPALAPDAADRLPATSPALGATAGGALKGLVRIADAAAPAIAPTLRTTATTKATIGAAAAPAIARLAERIGPTLGNGAASVMTGVVLPAAREIPGLIGAATPPVTQLRLADAALVTAAAGEKFAEVVNAAAAPDGVHEAGGSATQEAAVLSGGDHEVDMPQAALKGMGAPEAGVSGTGPNTFTRGEVAWPGGRVGVLGEPHQAAQAEKETPAPQAAPSGVGAPEMQPAVYGKSHLSAPDAASGVVGDLPWSAGQLLPFAQTANSSRPQGMAPAEGSTFGVRNITDQIAGAAKAAGVPVAWALPDVISEYGNSAAAIAAQFAAAAATNTTSLLLKAGEELARSTIPLQG